VKIRVHPWQTNKPSFRRRPESQTKQIKNQMLTKLKTLQNHAGFIRYFKNTSWMMDEQFLLIIVGLFVGMWVVLA
jgi:hypothetical protein